MNKIFLNKIEKNFLLSLNNYDNFSASKYWRNSIKKKNKLFTKNNLKNFRKNGLANNIDDFYLDKNESLTLFKELKKDCSDKFILKFLENKNYGKAKKIYKFKDKYLPAEEIVNLASKENWGLYHIAPHVTSLEDIFVQLTQVQTLDN